MLKLKVAAYLKAICATSIFNIKNVNAPICVHGCVHYTNLILIFIQIGCESSILLWAHRLKRKQSGS